MTGRSTPQYLILALGLAGVIAIVFLANAFFQYRALSNYLVEESLGQHEITLAASFERRSRSKLHQVADSLVFVGNDNDTQFNERLIQSTVEGQDEFVGLRFVSIDQTRIESPEWSDTTVPDGSAWHEDHLHLSYAVVRDGEFRGTLYGIFSINDFRTSALEFRDRLAENAIQHRRASLVWTAASVVLTLILCIFISWRFMRSQHERINELKIQAKKLGEADFSAPRLSSKDDDLGQLADVFNSMRDRLKQTTMSRDYFDSILSGMNEAIIVTTADHVIKKINTAASRMLGYTDEELVGQPISLIVDSRRGSTLKTDGPSGIPKESTLVTKSGEAVPISYTGSSIAGEEGSTDLIFAAQNIAERRKAEQRIRYLARIDALTKIPNRMQFQHLLQRSIARAKRTGKTLSLLYFDIDRFKEINDTFGHLAGDTTLETVAERLSEALPKDTVVGRLAGDEFAAIVEHFSEDVPESDLDGLARRVLDHLAEPFYVQGHEVFMTASLGIARYPVDAEDVIDLIRNADAALYSAKKNGGNVFAYYRPEMNEAAVERLMTKSKLKRAFERDELLVHYQPKYNIETGEVVGAEALVRWELPERGIILPSDFIPIAEETNLIIELGEWVLDRVCSDFRYWQRSVPSPGRVSVNLSLKQLRQPNFIKRISDILRSYQVSPTSLELEITETTLMENPSRTIKLLDELYSLGLHLAIDDFGTGYSSLSALQQFPISTLKIDKSFVRHSAEDVDDATIVATIVHMGRSLKMDVVAEGVETEDQLSFLQSLDCSYVQGLLFGDPMSSDNYLELLLAQLEGTDKHRALFA